MSHSENTCNESTINETIINGDTLPINLKSEENNLKLQKRNLRPKELLQKRNFKRKILVLFSVTFTALIPISLIVLIDQFVQPVQLVAFVLSIIFACVILIPFLSFSFLKIVLFYSDKEELMDEELFTISSSVIVMLGVVPFITTVCVNVKVPIDNSKIFLSGTFLWMALTGFLIFFIPKWIAFLYNYTHSTVL